MTQNYETIHKNNIQKSLQQSCGVLFVFNDTIYEHLDEETRRERENRLKINRLSRKFIDPYLTVYSPYNPLRRSFV